MEENYLQRREKFAATITAMSYGKLTHVSSTTAQALQGVLLPDGVEAAVQASPPYMYVSRIGKERKDRAVRFEFPYGTVHIPDAHLLLFAPYAGPHGTTQVTALTGSTRSFICDVFPRTDMTSLTEATRVIADGLVAATLCVPRVAARAAFPSAELAPRPLRIGLTHTLQGYDRIYLGAWDWLEHNSAMEGFWHARGGVDAG